MKAGKRPGIIAARAWCWPWSSTGKSRRGQTGSALAPSSAGTQATDYAGHGISPEPAGLWSAGPGACRSHHRHGHAAVGTSPIHWHLADPWPGDQSADDTP